jgi:hypothetical protein
MLTNFEVYSKHGTVVSSNTNTGDWLTSNMVLYPRKLLSSSPTPLEIKSHQFYVFILVCRKLFFLKLCNSDCFMLKATHSVEFEDSCMLRAK